MVHSWVVGGVCERVVGVGGGRHETGKDRMGGEGRGLLQRSERGGRRERRQRASAESVGRERCRCQILIGNAHGDMHGYARVGPGVGWSTLSCSALHWTMSIPMAVLRECRTGHAGGIMLHTQARHEVGPFVVWAGTWAIRQQRQATTWHATTILIRQCIDPGTARPLGPNGRPRPARTMPYKHTQLTVVVSLECLVWDIPPGG